jgi:hypothetical protein
MILSNEIKFYKSSFGSGPKGSLGGSIDLNQEIVNGSLENLFDNVTPEEAEEGKTEYRCIYVKNTNAIDTLLNSKIFIDSNTSSGSTNIKIGLGIAPIGSAEPNIQDESDSTGKFNPGGELGDVDFQTAPEISSALLIGDLVEDGPGYKSIWIQRIVSPDAEAAASDSAIITVRGETTAS